jgi:ribosomal-protein-alanine N-acetyltransferase
MSVRPARKGDVFPAGGAWTPAQLSEEIGKPGSDLFVDEHGYALFKHGSLVDIYVSPQGKGHGEALLRECLARVTFKKITLEVSERNAPARGLYAKLGFVVVGRRPKFYNDGSDALLMDLSL